MPALAPIAPRLLKRILELDGYKCVAEDAHTWILLSHDHPAVVPKFGELVALEIMDSLLNIAQIDNQKFFTYLQQAKKDCGLP